MGVSLFPTPAIPESLAVFNTPGVLVVSLGVGRFRFPFPVTILGITASLAVAPVGASVIADVNKNGTTIFTTQGNRPTIVATATATAAETVPDITAFATGDWMTSDVDQIGTTTPGSELNIYVRYRRL